MRPYQCNSASYRESQDPPSLPCRWSSLQIKVSSRFCVWEFRIRCCGAFCVTLAISLSEGELGSPCFPMYSIPPGSVAASYFDLDASKSRIGVEYILSRGCLTSSSSKKVGWGVFVMECRRWYRWYPGQIAADRRALSRDQREPRKEGATHSPRNEKPLKQKDSKRECEEFRRFQIA
jgi:hypothetical protein